MERTARRRVGVLVGLIAVLAAASVPAVSAQETGGPVTVRQDAGILRLRTGGGTVSVTYSGPMTLPSQTVSVSTKCGVTTAGELLSIVAPGSTFGVGLVSNGLGSRAKNTCSSGEGRVSAGESLTIALGSAFADDVKIVGAELDIEGKFNAKLGLAQDGGAVTQYTLASSSDNGPDSGVGDNDRVVVATEARGLTFTSVGGEIAVEGGGDGTLAQYQARGLGPVGASLGTADTIFLLERVNTYDNGVDCLESVDATMEGDAALEATFSRELNDGATTADDCDDIGVTFAILDNGVLLDKSTASVQDGEEEAVNSRVEILWAPQTAYPLKDVYINFEGDPNGVFELVQWCDGTDANGYIHPPDSRFADGILPWCLVSDTAVVQPDGSIFQTQVYDGKGDPIWQGR